VKAFVSKHAGEVIGVLSGFDRLVFRGTLRLLAHHLGMQQYLWAMQVLLKDFANHAEAVTRQSREASEAHVRSTGPTDPLPAVPAARKNAPGRDRPRLSCPEQNTPAGSSRPSPPPASRSRPPIFPRAIVNPITRGVPFGRRSPLQRGPFSTPKHTINSRGHGL
jgi:hypothetical protein